MTFVAIAAGLFIGANRLVGDQDQRLLNERTAEVADLLSTAVGSTLQSSMLSLAATSQSAAAIFTRTAQSQLASNPAITSIALVVHSDSGWVVQASVGSALAVGQTVTGPRSSLIGSADALVHTDAFVVSAGQTRLGAAIGPPLTAAGTVIYEEYLVDPSRPSPLTQSQPFHELNAALYAAAQPIPAKLLLSTTRQVPLRGRTASRPVLIGASTWLVVANARQPLSGALASEVPKILSAVALLIGIAMTVVVEGVGRRRDYALSLVGDRTAALEKSVVELEQAQQALVTSERLAALGQMAATVGHELRNPLGVLTNSLYLIRGTVAATADDKLRRQLDTADREISAATLIVSDLLEFSRPRLPNPTPIDLAELLAEAVSVAPPPSGIRVERDGEPVPPIVADRDQIRQVILNLLTNAYEAMPGGGTVWLGARVVDHAVEVIVSDTGIGMDVDTRAQMFEPFFSTKVKGTGLGLAVSKRIVNAHAGTLTMVSEPGNGCVATMTLPLSPAVVGAGG
jgi:signal transduction histidine kinase